MSNIDFEIGKGNPAAIAIRAHFAQHGYLSHMDFHTGSGLAALNRNRQRGRGFAFLRRALWHSDRQHFALLAIHADRFLVRGPARGGDPRAYGGADADPRPFTATCPRPSTSIRIIPISSGSGTAASRISPMPSPSSAMKRIRKPKSGLKTMSAIMCQSLRASAKAERRCARAGAIYRVANFILWPDGARRGHGRHAWHTQQCCRAVGPACDGAPAIPALPPSGDWINVHTLGVMGDGKTDDTAAIQKAVDAHRTLISRPASILCATPSG